MADKDVVPSGSVSVNDDAPAQDTAPAKPDAQPEKVDQGPYLASWKTKEDAEKGITELQKKMGEMGNEMGTLRQQNQQLVTHLTQQQQAQAQAAHQAAQQGTASPLQEKLNQTLAEYGRIDFIDDEQAPAKAAEIMKQAISLSTQLTQENTMKAATSQFQKILAEKDNAAIRNKFLQDNPEFSQLQGQGVFQAVKAQNPMHDDFSAFYAHKFDAANQQIAELQAQLEQAQKIANLADGDAGTSKVITKPGATVPTAPSKPRNVSELKQSALAAVMRARGG